MWFKRWLDWKLEITECQWFCQKDWLTETCWDWCRKKDNYKQYWQAAKLAKICNFDEPLAYQESINKSIELLTKIDNQ